MVVWKKRTGNQVMTNEECDAHGFMFREDGTLNPAFLVSKGSRIMSEVTSEWFQVCSQSAFEARGFLA